MNIIKRKAVNIFVLPILVIGYIFGIGATSIYTNVSNSYEFNGMRMTDFMCPVLVSSKVSQDITFSLSSKSAQTYEIMFLSTLTCTSLGVSTTKTTMFYNITHTGDSISVPFECITNADSYRFKVEYLIKTSGIISIKTLFDVNINPYNTNSFDSDNIKIIELSDIFLTLRNGTFKVSGLYFDFSYIRYDLLSDLPYGKIPLKCFKMILKENKYSGAKMYNSQFDWHVYFGVCEDFDYPIDGDMVFNFSRDGELLSKKNYALFDLTQVSKTNSDVVTFKLTNTFYLNETTNDMWSTSRGTDNGNHIYDVYIGYKYQNKYKGKRKCLLYFLDYTTRFFLYFYITLEFNSGIYKDSDVAPEVIGEFKDNENKPNKIYKI